MPSIKVTAAKGLHQVSGTTSIPSGTFSGAQKVVESLTAAKTLTVADSGKIFTLNLAAGFDVALPALTAANITGCVYEFIVETATSGGAYTITGGTADKMSGRVVDSSGGNEDEEIALTGDKVNLTDGNAKPGDRVTILCTSNGYHAYAITGATGAATITG